MCIQDKSGTKSTERSEDKKSTSKQKGKKENGHSSTATEKRRDQPLLLEFESLFESLQVHTMLCLQHHLALAFE